MNFIWGCMVLSFKAGLGAIFWCLAIAIILGLIGVGIYLASR